MSCTKEGNFGRWVGPAQLFPVACGSVPNNIYCPVQNPENTSISCTGNISHVCLVYENSLRRDPGSRSALGKRALNVSVFYCHSLQQNRKPDALQGQNGHRGSEGSVGILGGSEYTGENPGVSSRAARRLNQNLCWSLR